MASGASFLARFGLAAGADTLRQNDVRQLADTASQRPAQWSVIVLPELRQPADANNDADPSVALQVEVFTKSAGYGALPVQVLPLPASGLVYNTVGMGVQVQVRNIIDAPYTGFAWQLSCMVMPQPLAPSTQLTTIQTTAATTRIPVPPFARRAHLRSLGLATFQWVRQANHLLAPAAFAMVNDVVPVDAAAIELEFASDPADQIGYVTWEMDA